MASHCGDPSEHYMTFTADSDEEAKEVFEKEKKKPSNGMDFMWMEKIIQEEVTVRVCSGLTDYRKWSILVREKEIS
jgi:hypothetical protein